MVESSLCDATILAVIKPGLERPGYQHSAALRRCPFDALPSALFGKNAGARQGERPRAALGQRRILSENLA